MSKSENTKTDMTPKNWKFLKLQDIGTFKNGINKDKEEFGFGTPFVNLMDVFGKTELSKQEFALVNTNAKERNLYNLKRGDVLFVRSSVKPEGVGLTVLIQTNIEDTVFCGFLIRYRIQDGEIDHLFKKYCFYGRYFRKQLLCKSTISANTNINQESLKNLDILLPPLAEQKKIAEILGCWDLGIEKLDALITTKKKLKKALSQQLLTGKKRFKEFEGQEWKEVKLGDISDIGTGGEDNQNKVENGKYPFFVRSDTIERIDSYSYDGEAILIPGEGRIGEIFHYIVGKFNYHQRVYKISDFSEGVIGKYIYHYMCQHFKRDAITNSVKATVDSLRLPTFKLMKVKLPSLNEQQKIASVLNAADKEIEILSKKLESLKAQKKGLMQKLLTGQIRVRCQ